MAYCNFMYIEKYSESSIKFFFFCNFQKIKEWFIDLQTIKSLIDVQNKAIKSFTLFLIFFFF